MSFLEIYKERDDLAWLIPALLVPLIYWNALEIPFHYSEIKGIKNSSVATSLESFQDRMLTLKGLSQRPLSVLSYALNHKFLGVEPFGYHLINILIHLLNTFLLFQLAKRLSIPPLPASLVFAAHPLATATTSQIFGRNYSLATFFLLLALVHLAGRARIDIKTLVIQLVLFFLMLTCKQTLAIYPAVAFWVLYSRGIVSLSTKTIIGLCTAAVPGILLAVFYAAPLSSTSTISSTHFALSQVGNWPALVSFYLFPFQTAIIHDLPLFESVSKIEVLSGLILLGLTILFCIFKRFTLLGLILGCTLLLLLPTNSFFPKNEIIREWRLYPSLIFFSLLVGQAYDLISNKLKTSISKSGFRALSCIPLGLMMASVVNQNNIYSSHSSTWAQVTKAYPHSADAWNNMALAVSKEGKHSEAVHLFKKAIENKPEIARYYQNSAISLARVGKEREALEMAAKASMVQKVFGNKFQAVHYQDELERIHQTRSSLGSK